MVHPSRAALALSAGAAPINVSQRQEFAVLGHLSDAVLAFHLKVHRRLSFAALLGVCVAIGLGHIGTASGQVATPCRSSSTAINDQAIVPGERIGALRLAGNITDVVKMCGSGVVAIEGGPRKQQLFSLETWNHIGLWVQFDPVTGNVVWISIEVKDSNPWGEYSTSDGMRLGTRKEELVKVMGSPERVVTAGGYTSFYYDRRGLRFTLADAGRLAGKVGSIRVVWPSVPRGDTSIVPGKRISSAEVGMSLDRVLALLAGGYHQGEAAPGIHVYYWPHLGLSIVEQQGRVISVRAAKQTSSDASGIEYRTTNGVGQGSSAAEVKAALGEPARTDRSGPGQQWLIYRTQGVAFSLDDHANVNVVEVFQPETISEQRYIEDGAALLSPLQREEIQRLLEVHNAKGPAQLSLLTVAELPPNTSIEQFSLSKVRAGHAPYAYAPSNEVLIVIAVKDRKIRIEPSPDVSSLAPSDFLKKVIDEVMVPRFADAKYFEGIRSGIVAVVGILERKTPSRNGRAAFGAPFWTAARWPFAGYQARTSAKFATVGVLVNSSNRYSRALRDDFEQACRSIGIWPLFAEVVSRDALGRAVANIARSGARALVVENESLFSNNAPECSHCAEIPASDPEDFVVVDLQQLYRA